MKKNGQWLAVNLCLWLPPLFVLIKNAMLQGFIANDNAYMLDFGKGLLIVFSHFPLQAAVTLFLFSPMFLFKRKGAALFSLILDAVLTVILLVDITYYRCYNVLPSAIMLPVASSQGGTISIFSILPTLFAGSDLALAVDVLPLVALYVLCRRKGWFSCHERKGRSQLTVVLAGASALAVAVVPVLNLFGVATKVYRDRYVMTDTVEQSAVFSSAGFHFVDFFQTATGTVTNRKLSDTDEQMLNQYLSWKNTDITAGEKDGQFKGYNLIILQVESLESFVLGQTLNDQEVTPNLNRLINGGYYLPQIREQVKCGNSSDCDFILMTGLLPPDKGYAFGMYADRQYNSLQKLLRQNGNYTSYYYHGAVNSTWNYADMLTESLQVDYLVMDYSQDEILNGYISDQSFVRQTLEKLKQNPLNEPFYAHMVTCSSHLPCSLPDGYTGLALPESLAGLPMGDYLQAVHYADEQIGTLIEGLKANGLLEHTLLAVVGDHGGIHKYYPETVVGLKTDADSSWISTDADYTVPLILYNPSIADPQVYSVVGGQVDILPTLLSLLGTNVDTYKNTMFGRNLLSTTRSFAIGSNNERYGALSDEDWKIAQTMWYLSDRLLLAGRTN